LPFAEPRVPLFRVVRIYEKSPPGDGVRIPKRTAVLPFYSPRTVSCAIHWATARRLSVSS
jgi:hypothetical protein